MTPSLVFERPLSVAKRIARTVLPARWHLSALGPRLLREQIVRRTNMAVASDPFRGMRYVHGSYKSVWEPKVLGIYERELADAIGEAIARQPVRILDIGAAEGYYAVGLARAVPGAYAWAFEADEQAHPLLRDLIACNGVSARVHIGGLCTPDVLSGVLGDGRGTLVICDAEGGEADLLDPVRVAGLRYADILVELHAGRVPDVWQMIRERFAPTHDIAVIDQEARSPADYPYWSPLVPEAYVSNAVSEFRQPWEPWMRWYWMTARPAARLEVEI